MINCASSNDIGTKLLKTLGVQSERVRKATITMEVDCALMVTVEVYAEQLDDKGELAILLKNYKLVADDGCVVPSQSSDPDFSVEPPVVCSPKPAGPANEKVRDPFTALFYRVFGNGHTH
jgi:hypothetical protein